MILSMTGFGQAEAHANGVTFRVEIRAVNNRYFKASLRLPEHLQRYESQVDSLLRARLGRGTVYYTLRVVDENAEMAYDINKAALVKYVSRLRSITETEPGITIDLTGLLDIPGVCQPPDINEAVLAEQFAVIQTVTVQAVERLMQMRRSEGQALLKDLQTQCAVIRERLAQIETRAPLVVEEYARRLHTRIRQLLVDSNVELEKEAVSREVAIYAERCDINEELSRTRSHLAQFEALCAGPEEAGRTLEFIAQELLREANTMGSKANDAVLAGHVVMIKAAIDRIKEQVQNVQ